MTPEVTSSREPALTPDAFGVLVEGLNHPEGVTWSRVEGMVYAGGEGGEVYQVSLAGESRLVATTGGSMLGLAVDGTGLVYACDAGRGEIARISPVTGKAEVYARGVGGADLDTPNMAAFDRLGNLYVTCSGEDGDPAIVRIHPGAGEAEIWSQDVPAYPNGCAVNADSSQLIVVESKAQRIVTVPILADGSAGPPRVVARLPDTDADGVTLDVTGNLWITLYRPDAIVRATPDGAVVTVIDDHLATTFDAPTNLTFVGSDLDRAVVANVGDRFLLIGDLGTRGQPLHYPTIP